MQNFKSFLTEQSTNNYRLVLSLEYSLDARGVSDYLHDVKNQIEKEILEKFNVIADLGISEHSMSVELTLKDHQLSIIHKIELGVSELIEKFNDGSFSTQFNENNLSLYCEGTLPKNIKLNYRNMYITATGNLSLHGIDKLVDDFEWLMIRNLVNITDSVLGLIKLNKRTRKIAMITHTKSWVTIVKNYLDNHNDDILDCQEELISAGLKEYAKL